MFLHGPPGSNGTALPDPADPGSAAVAPGTIEVTYDRQCYDINDHLRGSIVIRGATAPVLIVKLALVRIECADEVRNSDSLIE